MYPFGFIHMLPPHILVSCQVGQYLPKAMLAQNWIPQHWIQLHCFCNLVCHKPQKSLMLSAVLDPEHSLGTLSEFGDLVPVVSTRKISVISPQLWTDHDGSWWIIRITNEICEICICCASCALIAPKGICSAENLKILKWQIEHLQGVAAGTRPSSDWQQETTTSELVQMDWFKERKLKGFRM